MKADQIVIKTTNTGKVTAVVMVMRKRCKSQKANLGNEKPSCQKVERAKLSRRKYPRIKKPFSKIKKSPDTKEISI